MVSGRGLEHSHFLLHNAGALPLSYPEFIDLPREGGIETPPPLLPIVSPRLSLLTALAPRADNRNLPWPVRP